MGKNDLGLTQAQAKTVLAGGVRVAITGLSDLCSARTASMQTLPPKPRDKRGKRIKTIIQPKPWVPRHWRADRIG
eukprot:1015699-Rhodomonas_salina.1